MPRWPASAAVGLLAVLLWAPDASAQVASGIRVRVVPQLEEVSLAPNERGQDDLTVQVTFTGGCSSDAEAGVDLVFGEPFPRWAGASIQPASSRHRYPSESQLSALEMVPDWEEAPRGSTVTYVISPIVHLPNETACPAPSIDARNATVRLFLTASSDVDGAGGGGLAPGFPVWATLVAFLLGRRAFR